MYSRAQANILHYFCLGNHHSKHWAVKTIHLKSIVMIANHFISLFNVIKDDQGIDSFLALDKITFKGDVEVFNSSALLYLKYILPYF